jgi:hypothetical protein
MNYQQQPPLMAPAPMRQNAQVAGMNPDMMALIKALQQNPGILQANVSRPDPEVTSPLTPMASAQPSAVATVPSVAGVPMPTPRPASAPQAAQQPYGFVDSPAYMGEGSTMGNGLAALFGKQKQPIAPNNLLFENGQMPLMRGGY